MRQRPILALLSAAAGTAMALAVLTGCGGAAKPPGSTGTNNASPDASAILGGAPTPSTSATGAPGPTGGAVPATPHSTLASKAGFVWVDQAASTYNPSNAYQFNSSGGAISVSHTGTGTYVVTFAGLGGPGGVAHAQAYGSSSGYCAINSWYATGSAQNVAVSCYNASGQFTDTMFVANFAVGSQDNARFGYLWADKATQSTKYHPVAAYRYDAVSSADLTVDRLGTGRYAVFVPSAGPELTDPWTFQITAYGSRNLCKLESFTVSSRTAVVACWTSLGGAADSQFSLSFSSEGSLIGRGDRHFGEASSATDVVQNSSPGVYVVRLVQLGADKGQVVALAVGAAATYCHVASWAAATTDLNAHISCFNAGGAPANTQFTVGATW